MNANIVESLQSKLKDWFGRSKLMGLYLIGSYSINEQNENSDFDFLGVSEDRLATDEILCLRKELQNLDKLKKYNIRFRSVNEITEFEIKDKSWGNNIQNAICIFGPGANEIFKSYNNIPTNQLIILDNLIEKSWFCLLYIKYCSIEEERQYLACKSILDLLQFLLYLNKKFIYSNTERLNCIKDNPHLLIEMGITIVDLENALIIKQKYCAIKRTKDYVKLNNDFLENIFNQYKTVFVNHESSFGEFPYWYYTPINYNNIHEIKLCINKLINLEVVDYVQNNDFIWRLCLISIFIHESNSMESNANIWLKCIVKKTESTIPKENNLVYLNFLEKIRIKSSPLGNDFI